VQLARRLYSLGHSQAAGVLRVPAGTIELFHGWVHAVEHLARPGSGAPAIRGEDRLRRLLDDTRDAGDAAPDWRDGPSGRKRGPCTPFHPAAVVRNFVDAQRLEPTAWRARAGAGTIELTLAPHASAVGADERPLVAFFARTRTVADVDAAALCPPPRADRLLTFLYAVGALAFHPLLASPWQLLGLQEGAPLEDIRRAYRRLALELHPDRHPTATADDLRDLERRFAEVSAAYRRLV
jgi:DnaJ domain